MGGGKMNIYISYPAYKWSEPDAKFRVIAKELSIKEVGSGIGFGQRDLHFECEDEKLARAFVTKCRRSKIGTRFQVKYYNKNGDIIK